MGARFFCLAVLASLGGSLSAVDYYVAATGNDDAPGTLAAPWKTIQRAANVMRPGDSCYI